MDTYRGHKFTGFLNFRVNKSQIDDWKRLVDEAILADRSVGYVVRSRVFPPSYDNSNEKTE